jgi:hypothetical protein
MTSKSLTSLQSTAAEQLAKYTSPTGFYGYERDTPETGRWE